MAVIMGAMSMGTAAAAVLVGALGPRGALSVAGWVGASAGVYGWARRKSIGSHGAALSEDEVTAPEVLTPEVLTPEVLAPEAA
jgi:hypothetical protein